MNQTTIVKHFALLSGIFLLILKCRSQLSMKLLAPGPKLEPSKKQLAAAGGHMKSIVSSWAKQIWLCRNQDSWHWNESHETQIVYREKQCGLDFVVNEIQFPGLRKDPFQLESAVVSFQAHTTNWITNHAVWFATGSSLVVTRLMCFSLINPIGVEIQQSLRTSTPVQLLSILP